MATLRLRPLRSLAIGQRRLPYLLLLVIYQMRGMRLVRAFTRALLSSLCKLQAMEEHVVQSTQPTAKL